MSPSPTLVFESLNRVLILLHQDIGLKGTKSFGLHLMRMLAEDQLEGTIDTDRSNGPSFIIHFTE